MARYTGSVCKLCRREGSKLMLKGARCMTSKCAFERRAYVPGQHGAPNARKKVTDYGIHLREKQKARRIYGVLERQFKKYFEIADRKSGETGDNLLVLLERRLDNVVYRMGFAPSRNAARQIIRHGHVQVNGHKVNIPSYLVNPTNNIEIKETSRSMELIQDAVQNSMDSSHYEWLSVDRNNYKGEFLYTPKREQVEIDINANLIVEFYSK
ncbi:MAG TPA: 30S ribosomal protein S4 [Candidatus Cloacimonadota bacterium]|nr:30S ribosomal protein S4 [Candidatus Cloacimonadales bacterium]HPY96926.1 30S ribosomal protein S4 [Candidatus Cloacimonadota bacterium]HQB40457.1 30S ribosomal protein S4 [Candidatus Cloacimonadota bacterium]